MQPEPCSNPYAFFEKETCNPEQKVQIPTCGPTVMDIKTKWCFYVVYANSLLLPSSSLKASPSPMVSKIDNRLEQYTSAAQVGIHSEDSESLPSKRFA